VHPILLLGLFLFSYPSLIFISPDIFLLASPSIGISPSVSGIITEPQSG
jgi:hypothetical protein